MDGNDYYKGKRVKSFILYKALLDILVFGLTQTMCYSQNYILLFTEAKLSYIIWEWMLLLEWSNSDINFLVIGRYDNIVNLEG